jgi:hypothetical protein
MRVFTLWIYMNDILGSPLIVLVALTSIGGSLAVGGVVLGVGDGVIGEDHMGEIRVTGDNITAASSEGETVLTTNVSETSDIEFTEDGETISVTERENTPLTQREQERAIRTAQNNQTVASYLETIKNEEFTVKPVKQFDKEAIQTDTIEIDTEKTDSSIVSEEYEVINVTLDQSEDTVTVDRTPSYVEDRAVVQISHTGRSNARYWVKVDLANKTITDITDRDDL